MSITCMMDICTIRMAIMWTNTRSKSARKTRINVRPTTIAAAMMRATFTVRDAGTSPYRTATTSITWSMATFIIPMVIIATTTAR